MNTPMSSVETERPRVEPGAVIGEKYKISRLLGEGGMGAVYEAENTWTRRRVAVKVMRPEYASSPDAVQRFLREAQSAAQLDHPNVVSVLDMGRDAATGSLFIVQEFLVGQDLATLMEERGALEPQAALELILPVMDGLAAAHALGVVHRDLKPENIFLVRGRSGRVVPKIIDFGIAKALGPRGDEFRTAVSQIMGTPAYMSPEQARCEPDVDGRSDVWAMGVVLYELLTGELPYNRHGNPQIMLAQVITQEPRSIDLVAPHLPEDLRSVVSFALIRDREKRLANIASFYVALTATSVGHKVRDTLRRNPPAEVSQPHAASLPDATPAPATPAPATPAAPDERDAEPGPASLTSRPLHTPTVVVGVVALVAVIAAAAIALRKPTPRPTVIAQPPPTVTALSAPPTPLPPTGAGAPQHGTQPPSPSPPSPAPPRPQSPPSTQPLNVVRTATSDAGEAPRDRHTAHRSHQPAQRGANGAAIIE